MQEFSDFAEEKYLGQIESDHANIQSRLTLMENTIKTVQGIIDIERTKNDRQLNYTVAIAGVGLATSQIASAAILAQFPDKPTPTIDKISVFVVSLLIGAIASVLTYKLLHKRRH